MDGRGTRAGAEHTTIRWTDAGRAVARHHDRFIALGDYLATFTDNAAGAWTQPWDTDRSTRLAELVDAAAARWELDDLDGALREQTAAQLDGALVSPVLLWLDAGGGLAPDGDGPRLPPGDSGEQAGRLLAILGWLGEDGAGPRPAATGWTSSRTSASSAPICRCSPACPSCTAASSPPRTPLAATASASGTSRTR